VSYTAEAGMSAPTASDDFRRLVDAGLVVRWGEGAEDAVCGERGTVQRGVLELMRLGTAKRRDGVS
jgi:hypothetical protein